MSNWNHLSPPQQLHLAESALRQATESLTSVAETLAVEIDQGKVSDHGGPEALRLFVGIVRAATEEPEGTGHA